MKSRILPFIAILIILMCAGIFDVRTSNFVHAQLPTQLPIQLTNEYRGTLGSFPHSFIDFKGATYFGVAGNLGGFWQTDGTEEGTTMVKDVRLDYNGSWNRGDQLIASSRHIFFIAGQPATEPFVSNRVEAPFELWRSDGTPDGTIKLYEFIDEGYFRRPPMIIYQDTLYFTTENEEHGVELWRSDGTVEGTAMFIDIRPGSDSSAPTFLSIVKDLFYFSASTEDGRAIWQTDGTADGTKPAISFENAALGDSHISNLVGANDSLYFTTFGHSAGGKFWRSDGTTAGTEVLQSSYPHPVGDAVEGAGGLFYWLYKGFYANAVLWFTDGTEEGTTQLLSNDVIFNGNVVPTDEYLYFAAKDAEGNPLTWRSDGTVDGTIDLGEPLIRLKSVDGDDVYYQGNDAHGYELWRTNGTITGTNLITDIVPSSLDDRYFSAYPSPIHPTDDGVLFGINDGTFGKELWRSDGTAEGTALVKDINTIPRGLSLRQIVAADDVVYMVDDWNHALGHRFSIMKSDGTTNGTELIRSFELNQNVFENKLPKDLYTVGNTLFYLHSGNIWTSDGTTDGTMILVASAVSDMYAFDEMIYFSKNDELWRTDGTQEGTEQIKDFQLTDPSADISARSWQGGGNILYFVIDAPQGGSELWKSDGTEYGTVVVKRDSADGLLHSFPRSLFYHEGLLYFSDYVDESFRLGLWITDGTDEGSRLVTSAETELSPSGFAVISRPATTRSTASDSLVLFGAYSEDHGSELWRTDGTDEGTEVVLDIVPGRESSSPQHITSMGSYILFVANDNDDRRGLWRSDGTAEGTQMIANLRMGADWQVNETLLRVGDFLYFSADDGLHGAELWRSDGSEAGTIMVADLNQGEASSNPSTLAYREGMLYFSANNGVNGAQLHGLSVEAPTALSTMEEPTLGLRNYLPLFSSASQ